MDLLRRVITIEVWAFLLALAAIVLMGMLTGAINISGLLNGMRRNENGNLEPYFSPERAQLLIFTLATAFTYVSGLFQNPTPGKLPDLPQGLVAALGGSHAIYLGGKAYSMLLRNSSAKDRT
jgi:hypothetical protein